MLASAGRRVVFSAATSTTRPLLAAVAASSSSSLSSLRTRASITTPHRYFSSSADLPVRPLTVFSEQEEMVRDMTAKFAQEHMVPLVREMDETGVLQPQLLQALFDNGLMGIETPEEMGGGGMSFTEACIVIEELAKVDPAISVICDIQNTLINTIFRSYASEALIQQYLPRLATDTLASFCLSEASSGSDAFALKTSATHVNTNPHTGEDTSATGGGYLLNGSKLWISNANEAGLFLVFATVDPSLRHRGITCFVMDKAVHGAGFTVGKKEDKCGIRASSTCELVFEDVYVPADHMLGEKGKGYKIAIGALNEGRIGIGAQMLGLAQGAYDAALPYLHQRKQFGTAVADFQGMQFSTAQARVELEAARLLVYNAARMKDAGLPMVQEAAIAKLHASQTAEKVSSKAVEWMGGVGYTKEFPVEKFWRDSKIGAIYEGTTHLMLQTIAKLEDAKFK